jgi:hypothetical protein
MPATAEQAIEQLQIVYTVTGDDRVQAAGKAVARQHDDVTTSTARAERATAQFERQLQSTATQYQNNARATGQLAAANDNVARSYKAANDNLREAGRTWADSAVQTAELANHLKLAAVAAYALSPAFRTLVNPAIAGGLSLTGSALAAMSPAAASLAGVIASRLLPALSFLGRIALPITLAVEAWRALNYVIDLGSGLLDKYGNAQRNVVADVDESLKKLTKFQDNDLSAQQVQYATELGARLVVAKQTISDFLKVQLDLTDPALKLQAAWVRIVELIAIGVDRLNDFLNLLSRVPGGLSSLGNVASATPFGVGILAYRGLSALAGAGPAEPTREEALAAARARLAAGLGSQSNFANRFGQGVNDLANPKKDEEKAESVKKVVSEFDRLEKSMQRSAAVQEAEARAVDASVGEHARLRTELRLQEAALQDIAKNGGTIDDYAERIKVLADRFGKAAQEAAELKLKSDIKFNLDTAFLSDSEKQIATILRQVYGSEWKNMMDGPIAGAIRFNNALKDIVDTTREIGGTILKSVVGALMQGKNVGESLSQALQSLSARLADKAIESLLSGDFSKAAISGISAAATFIGSKLFGSSDADKELQKAKDAWAGMTDQLKEFQRTAQGFDLSGPAQQILALKNTADQLWVAAMKAQDFAGARQVIDALTGNQRQVVKAFEDAQTPMSDFARQITTLSNQAVQLVDTLHSMGSAVGDDVLAKLPAQIDAIRQAAAQSLQEGINSAQGRGFINDLSSLFAQVQQFRNEQSITGIPTSLINDYFVAQAQKIVDDASLVGQSFNDLLTIFPQLTGLVHESTSALQDQADAQRQLTSELNAAARGIVDYVSNLRAGPDSALSPSGRLSAAQATYNATYALAQQGNIDALNRVTSDFENLRKAAQAFFGSSSGYQNILNSGIAQLLSLPAVTQSADPVVAAVRDVQTAIGQTTSAVNNDTNTTAARLDTAINALAATVGNLAAVLGRLDTGNSIASAIQGLQSTASQQLTLLNNNLTITGGSVTAFGQSAVGPAAPANATTANNNMLTALNKIVVNTGATAFNTAVYNVTQGWSRLLPVFEKGGILGAGQIGIMGEHHPQGPFVIKAGSSPIPIWPSMPANDNSSLVAVINRQTQIIAELLQRIVMLEQRNIEATERGTVVASDAGEQVAQASRMAARRKAA